MRSYGLLQKKNWEEIIEYYLRTDEFSSLDFSALCYHISLDSIHKKVCWSRTDKFGKKEVQVCLVSELTAKLTLPPIYCSIEAYFDTSVTEEVFQLFSEKVSIFYFSSSNFFL